MTSFKHHDSCKLILVKVWEDLMKIGNFSRYELTTLVRNQWMGASHG